MIEILLLCPGNATRSILAEAILRRVGGSRIHANSAGPVPMGIIPHATRSCLAARNLPLAGLRSKSWHEFLTPGAPPMDVIVALCPTVATECHPPWPGSPGLAHWLVEDPMSAPADQREMAFGLCAHALTERIEALISLPLDQMSGEEIARHIDQRADVALRA